MCDSDDDDEIEDNDDEVNNDDEKIENNHDYDVDDDEDPGTNCRNPSQASFLKTAIATKNTKTCSQIVRRLTADSSRAATKRDTSVINGTLTPSTSLTS